MLLSQDIFTAEPAWGHEQELLSTSSMASSGTDGCVPELSRRSLPSIVVKGEACVPDYPASCNGSPCMPPIHSDQVSFSSLPAAPTELKHSRSIPTQDAGSACCLTPNVRVLLCAPDHINA